MIEPKDTITINVTDTRKGRSALHCAALHGHADTVGLLLPHGADATLKDGFGATAHTALELCHAQWATLRSTQHKATLSTLIDYDPLAAARNSNLFAIVAINGSTSILEKLLNEKADLNEPDQHGWTPLLLAQQFQRTEAVKLLSRQIAHTGMKPTRWTYTYNDEWMQIPEDGCSLKHFQRSRHFCVLADNPIPAGPRKYYYEIVISRGPGRNGINTGRIPIFAIGFYTSSAHLLEFPGCRKTMRQTPTAGHTTAMMVASSALLRHPDQSATPRLMALVIILGVVSTTTITRFSSLVTVKGSVSWADGSSSLASLHVSEI